MAAFNFTVKSDGSGDFSTISAAIAFIIANNNPVDTNSTLTIFNLGVNYGSLADAGINVDSGRILDIKGASSTLKPIIRILQARVQRAHYTDLDIFNHTVSGRTLGIRAASSIGADVLDVVINRCRFNANGVTGGSGGNFRVRRLRGDTTDCRIQNCIFDQGNVTSVETIMSFGGDGTNLPVGLKWMNNTFICTRHGFDVFSGTDSGSIYKNNYMHIRNFASGTSVYFDSQFNMRPASALWTINNNIYNRSGGPSVGPFWDGQSVFANWQSVDGNDLAGFIADLSSEMVGFSNTPNRNLRPLETSPVIGAGENLFSEGVETDFDGLARLASGAFDVGAHRFPTVAAGGGVGVNKRDVRLLTILSTG